MSPESWKPFRFVILSIYHTLEIVIHLFLRDLNILFYQEKCCQFNAFLMREDSQLIVYLYTIVSFNFQHGHNLKIFLLSYS